MKQKTPEQLPEFSPEHKSPAITETLNQFKKHVQHVDDMPEKRPEDIVQLKVDAEELEHTLPTALASEIEEDPKIAAYMREHNLPLWNQINHEHEMVA